MAALEKILKAVEYLKFVSRNPIPLEKNEALNSQKLSNNPYPLKKRDADSIRKEKLHHIYTLVDSFSQKVVQSRRNNEEFLKMLSVSFETLFLLCDDPDSDLRMVANEALNKIIKSLMDTTLGKVQIELYKEIKRNGSARSLRAVLWRFGELAHLIMPLRRRPYVTNLIPIFVKLSKRTEESVLETLATMICKVWSVLGEFANEKELELLLNEFTPNIKHSSPVVRRATVKSITAFCQYSRKPQSKFLSYLWNLMAQDDDSPYAVLGVLQCIRSFHPFLVDIERDNETDSQLEHLIIKICFTSIGSTNHNIVTASLETLYPLLRNPPLNMLQILLEKDSLFLDKWKDTVRDLSVNFKSVEDFTPSSTTEDNQLFDDKANFDGLILKIESNLEGNDVGVADDLPEEFLSHNPSSDMQNFDSAVTLESEESKSDSNEITLASSLPVQFDLSSIDEVECPLMYMVRFIVSSYLLPNVKGSLIPDKLVRISIKSLSLNCLGAACALHKKAITSLLSSEEDSQPVSEVLLYANHPDPQIRGAVYSIIETLITLTQWNDSTLLNIDNLVDILTKGLTDDAPSSCRQAVIAVRSCISNLLNSNFAGLGILLCKQLLYLENSTYWLLKVELLETISVLPIPRLLYAQYPCNLQEKIFDSVKTLVSDEDIRVRNSASKCICRIIPNIVPAQFNGYRDSINVVAERDFQELFDFKLNQEIETYIISKNLQSVVTFLFQKERFSNYKYLNIGCIEALFMLTKEYPVSMYKDAWGCSSSSSQGLAYVERLYSLLTYHPISSDLTVHANILNILSHIITGIAQGCLKERVSNEPYSHIKTKNVSDFLQSILHHIIKVLSLCSFVIEGSNLKSYNTSYHLRKRKTGNNDPEKEDKGTEERKVFIGQFTQLPEFLKLMDSLAGSYSNYKSSLDIQSEQKLVTFIDSMLSALQILLSNLTLTEIGPITEELLTYLDDIVLVCSGSAIVCVHELLRSLSGSKNVLDSPCAASEDTTNLYYICFANQYASLHRYLTEEFDLQKITNTTTISLLSSPSSDSSIVLASYIRLFENVVVEGLRLYTGSNKPALQSHVLELLVQLIHLKVNYALLDSEQTFIKFVLRQLEAMELQQSSHSKVLVECIFRFLVLLSYEHLYSKGRDLISIPKILQYCDAFTASGAPPTLLCIPALKPVVQDVFLVRPSIVKEEKDLQELDTQKEVLLSMLLRLAYYPEVYDMLTIILHTYKEVGQSKWSQVSRSVADTIFPLLMTQNIIIESSVMPVLNSLKSILGSLSPCVYRPIHQLMQAFIILPEKSTPSHLAKWLCCLLACMEVLLRMCSEEIILLQMSTLGLYQDANNESEPHEALAAFILESLALTAQQIHDGYQQFGEFREEYESLCQLLAYFLLYFAYMCQSGLFCHVAVAAKALVVSSVKTTETLHAIFLDLASVKPSICLLWCYLLLQLDYNDLTFWKRVLNSSENFEERKACIPCASLELVKRGGIILLCDYLCDNLQDAEALSLLFVNHIEYVIDLSPEPPVKELIDAVNRNPAACGLLVQAIHTHCDFSSNPLFSLKAFRCIRNTHPSQWGKIVILLIEKSLNSPLLTISRRANNMACHYIEWLLQQQPQFSEEVMERLKILVSEILPIPQFRKISALLCKLGLKVAVRRLSPLLPDPSIEVNYNSYLSIVRQWYQTPENQPTFVIELLSPLKYSDSLSILLDRNHSLRLLLPALKVIHKDWGELRAAAEVATMSHIHHSIAAHPRPLSERLLQQKIFWSSMTKTAAAAEYLMQIKHDFSPNDISDLVSFCLLCLEAVKLQIICQTSPYVVDTLLGAVNEMLKLNSIFMLISNDEKQSSDAILCLYNLVKHYDELQVVEDTSNLDQYQMTCRCAHALLSWTQTNPKLPSYLLNILNKLIVATCRFSSVYPVAVLPFFSECSESNRDLFAEPVIPFCTSSLQETEVLLHYVYRLMSLGWTRRQEFEESWMTLLGLLNIRREECVNPDVEAVLLKSTCVAIKAITGLLVFSLLTPESGNPHNSAVLHLKRCAPDHTKQIKSPSLLEDFTLLYNNYVPCPFTYSENLERMGIENHFGSHQISLNMIKNFLEEKQDDNPLKIRAEKLASEGIDTLSCIRFLLDLYNTWMINQCTPITVLSLAVQSTIILSDIFTEKGQYKWMFDSLLELHKSGSTGECDITLGLLTLGICKAGALLEVSDGIERMKVIYEEALNSNWLSTRCLALSACLYLLEGGVDAQLTAIMPMTLEYLDKHLPCKNSSEHQITEHHHQLLWAVATYCTLDYPQWQLSSLKTFHEEISNRLDLLTPSMLTRFESISCWYLNETVPRATIPGLRKVCLKLLNNSNYRLIYYGLKILVCDLYTGFDEDATEVSAEKHLMALERFMLLHSRTQKSCNFEPPFLCCVLKQILRDFIHASDVIHKLLSELLIHNQSHPSWTATLLFHIFGGLPREEIIEWTIPSLTSYVKMTPLPIGMWRLSCLLVAATQSPWLRKLFTVLYMHNSCSEENVWLFSLCAHQFYNELEMEDEKSAFLACLEASREVPYQHVYKEIKKLKNVT